MKVFGYEFGKVKEKEAFKAGDSADIMALKRVELPKICELKNKDWVLFGENNNYPKELLALCSTSALHNAIVKSKSRMMAGSDIAIKGVEDSKEYIKTLELHKAVQLASQIDQFDQIREPLSVDFQTMGAYAFEVIYNFDFSRILEMNHVEVQNIRSGKYVNGKIENYYYSDDWNKGTVKPITIAAFDPKNKKDHRQLIYRYEYSTGQSYYGKPSYQSALSWIKLDSEIGLFHLSNIENGFFPSIHMSYYKKPASKEEQNTILAMQKQQFKGADNAGKVITTFSDGKELAPEIKPIQVSDLDKQFIIIGETAVQQIISAHRVTSPMLLGVATPGKLGYSNELEPAMKIFENTVIAPERLLLQNDFNKIMQINAFSERIELKSFNPLL